MQDLAALCSALITKVVRYTCLFPSGIPLLSQGFTNVQTASGSSCVASGASAEGGGDNRNSNGSPTPVPTVGTGCQVANCAACRGAPTNCYLCKSVRP